MEDAGVLPGVGHEVGRLSRGEVDQRHGLDGLVDAPGVLEQVKNRLDGTQLREPLAASTEDSVDAVQQSVEDDHAVGSDGRVAGDDLILGGVSVLVGQLESHGEDLGEPCGRYTRGYFEVEFSGEDQLFIARRKQQAVVEHLASLVERDVHDVDALRPLDANSSQQRLPLGVGRCAGLLQLRATLVEHLAELPRAGALRDRDAVVGSEQECCVARRNEIDVVEKLGGLLEGDGGVGDFLGEVEPERTHQRQLLSLGRRSYFVCHKGLQ